MASSGYCFDNTGGGALVEGVNPTEIHQKSKVSENPDMVFKT